MAKTKETYKAVCRKHWSCFILPGFFALMFLIVCIWVLAEGGIGQAAVMLIIAAVIILCTFVTYKTTYIALTETKIVGKTGVIRTKTLTTPISKVQNVGIGNGLLGKILRYHTVTISDAGNANTEFVFTHMAKAQSFVDAVQEAIAR